MPKISLMIHTASFDDFLTNQGINSYFKSLTHCLGFQTFKDFELIYVDTFYEENKEQFAAVISTLPFQVKHVPIHANHRYWFDKGYCYISAAKNTGILYADGDLLITCDDAEFFPEHLFQAYWNHYESSHYMIAVHKRMKSINLHNEHPSMPISGDVYVNDNRLISAKNQILKHKYGSWAYAGTSFALSDALLLNGFNEKMDGCKSLEDCDFGNRLVLLGRNLVTDTEGYFYILEHKSYADVAGMQWEGSEVETPPVYCRKKIENFIAIENYGMLKCATELYEIRANQSSVTDKHLKIIQKETLFYRHFDPLGKENQDKLTVWLGTPNFNLTQEREELRKGDWKWKN